MKSQIERDLRPFFEPRSVAVVGSLREEWGEGYMVIRNMLRFGFTGNIYPVNPSYSEVLGIKAYPTVNEVKGPIDLAMVITPPPSVLAILEQCAQKGIKAVIVGTEGFAETGEAGARLQQQLVDMAHSNAMRLIGPNTIGIVNTSNGLITNPYPVDYDRIWKGNIAYGSQTGFVGAQGQPLEDRAYPISKMCDFGNKCDINEADLLDYLLSDAETKAIALHMEAVKDGREFMDTLGKVTAHKPVLIFKTGRTEQGARASVSHTGSLAGSAQVYDTVFKQAGAIQVGTWQEFWEIPKVFASQPLPRGNRFAIVTPTGGVGVVAIDAAVEAGLAIAQLCDATVDRLAKFHANPPRNPVDLGPSMVLTEDPLSVLEETIGAVLDDANVDCATIVLAAGMERWASATVNMFDRLRQHISKPITIWIYGTTVSMTEEVARQLEAMGLPTYLELETAIKALGIAADYAKFKSNLGHKAS
ncbi:MAG: CoA-binding protein [Dehalococcoidia bacterium]|nr:CoA-binding protein [Dehalococcoidia bacterium]